MAGGEAGEGYMESELLVISQNTVDTLIARKYPEGITDERAPELGAVA